ncbi:4-hydroxythreonine-4-phosphate dehydrogenase PdxA [Bacteroidota bacterium]
MKNNKIIVGITHGDINGIGYEIIIKTFMDTRMLDFCIPIVYGSPKAAAYHRKALNINNFNFNNIKNPEEANAKRTNIINCLDDNVKVELGKLTKHAGECAVISLESAVKDLKDGKIDVLVTAPINKSNIQSDSFRFPGHTEYFSHQFNSEEVLMLMISDTLKIGVVAGHVPLQQVPAFITVEKITKKLKIFNDSLIKDFGIRKPKIAVLGLNPHAGDNGLLGSEEEEIIIPALNHLKEENIMVFGPYPADGFFGSGMFSKFDGTLAMYHDQGLAPFKTLIFESGVNFTAGLPIIRTAPVHGTAFELAGKDQASNESFRNAIYAVCDIYNKRNNLENLMKNRIKNYDTSEI